MPPIQPSLRSDRGAGELTTLEAEDRFLLAVAAHRPDLLPASLSDIDYLTERIREHRLDGRCRRHTSDFKDRGYPKALLDAVDALDAATDRDYLYNQEAVEGIVVRMGSDFGVVIKGFTTHLLTGDRATLRCGDIDVVVADSAPVIDYLLKSGFRQTRAPFLHEVGEFSRDNIEFDIQWGFPVCRYPDDLNEDSEQPLRACGLMVTEHIDAEFMRDHSETAALGSVRIRVPTVELAALITASHAFMNYTNIWSISHRRKAWLRLAEFADILDLRLRSTFSIVRFHQLIERFRAQDIIAWANATWDRLVGEPLFPDVSLPLSCSSVTPCCLWWNLWIRLEPPSQLLLRESWFPLHAVLRILERSVLGGPSQCPEHTTILRLLWEDPEWRGIFRFLYLLVGNSLRLTLDFERAGRAPKFRIRIDVGVHAEEITADADDGKVLTSTTSLVVGASINGAEINLDLDLRRFGSQCCDDAGCIGYVGVAAEKTGRILACTVLPFRLQGAKA